MIDDLLDQQVIQPSRATAWSQFHLVRKPTNGWRFTVDSGTLIRSYLMRAGEFPIWGRWLNWRDDWIGSLRPTRFAIVDLMSGFFQMPLDLLFRQYTAFITFRGIYEWTRVPMGLLPSANFFQKIRVFMYVTASYITSVRCTLMTCSYLARTNKHVWTTLARFSNVVANVTWL